MQFLELTLMLIMLIYLIKIKIKVSRHVFNVRLCGYTSIQELRTKYLRAVSCLVIVYTLSELAAGSAFDKVEFINPSIHQIQIYLIYQNLF